MPDGLSSVQILLVTGIAFVCPAPTTPPDPRAPPLWQPGRDQPPFCVTISVSAPTARMDHHLYFVYNDARTGIMMRMVNAEEACRFRAMNNYCYCMTVQLGQF